MRPTTQEIASLRRLLELGAVTSRSAVLLVLAHGDTGSCQIGPLAARLGFSIPRVSMLGDTMVKMGLVDRCVPASDLRKASLALTVVGYAAARGVLGALRDFSSLERASSAPESIAGTKNG